MDFRAAIQKRIEAKDEEIRGLEIQIREARAYLQSLNDTLRLLPKENLANKEVSLRPGSALAKARDAIRKAGKPLQILELLKAMGKPQDSKNRAAVSGTLSAYVRKQEVFTRPAPNVFGLIELQASKEDADQPPATFGTNGTAEEPAAENDPPF